MRIDHVLYGVRDLAEARQWFAEEFGLTAVPGGAHPEIGTENALISAGPGQYIELISVADTSVDHPLPKVLNAMLADGDRPIGLCLRPRDLDIVAARLGVAVSSMHREAPDGTHIEWRLAGMEAALGPERLPFFIDWGAHAAQLDAENAAAAPDGEISRVELGGSADVLRSWIGEEVPEVVSIGGDAGVAAIFIRRGGEELALRAR